MTGRQPGKQWRPLGDEPIKFHADYQLNWPGLVRPLKRGKYIVESTSCLSIPGDAPKCFLCVKEYTPGRSMLRLRNWPKYIAKVGSKWYPIESITEQLIARVGRLLGFEVADSRLALVGRQVRFLSRYFLRREESLIHGIELFRSSYGEEFVREVASERAERDFYTFPVVVDSIRSAFPGEAEEVVDGLIRMLAFDALVGNNDRHPANWGVISSVRTGVRSRFSPIFDTARGLFWNNTESFVRERIRDGALLDRYIERSRPQIGWDGIPNLDHFTLLRQIAASRPDYQSILRDAVGSLTLDDCARMIREEFGRLLSNERLRLIELCLRKRLERVREAVTG